MGAEGTALLILHRGEQQNGIRVRKEILIRCFIVWVQKGFNIPNRHPSQKQAARSQDYVIARLTNTVVSAIRTTR